MCPASESHTTSKPTLGCSDLEVTFRIKSANGTSIVAAVKDVNLQVPKDKFIGLIGESGSGKTTVARAMVGLQKPSSGSVFCTGIDEGVSGRQRRRKFGRQVSMVFQDPRSSLNPRLTVETVIKDPLIVHNVGSRHSRSETVERLLDDVGLPSQLARRPVRTLSGGQLQRVALARALSLDPDFIVADEPTSALDVSVQAQIINLITDLRASHGFGMLVISHDMRVMRALTDEIVVMLNGEVVESGPTDRVFDSPQNAYTRELLLATPLLRAREREL